MLGAAEAAALCDENTIAVAAILGSTFDGRYEPVAEIAAALDALERDKGIDVPIHVDAASGGFIAPFIQPDLTWDFRIPRRPRARAWSSAAFAASSPPSLPTRSPRS